MFHVEHFGDSFLKDEFSPEILEKLEIYHRLLCKWQKAINLVSNDSLDEFWTRHVLDSWQLIPYIRGTRVLDVGSGGGFPGMVLAISGRFHVTCVDSDARKMVFLSEVARQTGTKVSIVTDRIENVIQRDFDTVCSRGFSELKTLVSIVHDQAACGVFLKGKQWRTELAKAQSFFDFEYEIFDSRTDKTGVIVVIHSVSERGA